MSAQPEAPRLEAGQLKVYDDRVRRILMDVVNNYGVRCRIQDGSHLLLYPVKPGDRKTFKVAASRDAEATLNLLCKWAGEQVGWRLKEKGPADLLAAKFNNPDEHPPRPAVVSEATQTLEAPQIASSPGSVPCPDGYHQNVGVRGQATPWWTDGVDFVCQHCGKHAKYNTMGGHRRVHTGTVANANTPQALDKAAVTRQKTRVRKLLTKVAEEFDIDISPDAHRVAKLQAQLDKVTAERDDALARIALIKEGLRA